MPTARRTDRSALINPEDHVKWAKAIARGVGNDYRVQKGSQEELELEATANLVICEYAPRFDAVLSFKKAAALHMSRAVLATPRGASPIAGPSALDKPIVVCGTDVTAWVRDAARRLSRHRTVGREACYEAVARAAAGGARAFDPVGAFRGWCAIEVRSRCRREAVRLKNGGTFNTKRHGGKTVFVVGLPRPCSANPASDFGESQNWSDVIPKWVADSGELDEAAGRVRLDQVRPGPALAPPDRRPALHEDEEPWAACDTTPDD